MTRSPWTPDLARAAMRRAGFTYIADDDMYKRGTLRVSGVAVDSDPRLYGEHALDMIGAAKEERETVRR